MNQLIENETSSVQKELEALRERLRINSEIMKKSSKKKEVNETISGVISVVGTFEKK